MENMFSLFAPTGSQAKLNLRKEKDVHKLLVSKFEVKLPNENDSSEMHVKFEGPKDSPFEGVSIIFIAYSNRVFGTLGSAFQSSIPSNHHRSASATKFTTPTSTNSK